VRPVLGRLWIRERCEERLQQGAQKPSEPAQEEAKVVAGGGEHSIDAVAVAPLQIIAAHAVLGLGMADDRFDGGAAPHLATDRFRAAVAVSKNLTDRRFSRRSLGPNRLFPKALALFLR